MAVRALLINGATGALVTMTAFWAASFGGSSSLVVALLTAVCALISLIWQAWRCASIRERAIILLGVGGIHILLAMSGMWCGRFYLRTAITARLGEYNIVVDALRMEAEKRAYSGKSVLEHPHADVAWADIEGRPDAFVARLAFRRSPRQLRLLFAQNVPLPERDSTGRCLNKIEGQWYWYLPCD